MEISTTSNIVKIEGNIKSISHFQEIKTTLDLLINSHKEIVIELKDSISITSSVLGYFNKLILKDKIKIYLRVGDSKLISLLSDLNLSHALNVKKI